MDDNELPFLGGRLPAAFERRWVEVAPGESRAYDPAEWDGAIVVVQRGVVDVEYADPAREPGRRRRYERGDVLWLADLPIRSLHNPGEQSALLVAVARRHTAAEPPDD